MIFSQVNPLLSVMSDYAVPSGADVTGITKMRIVGLGKGRARASNYPWILMYKYEKRIQI